MSHHQFPINFQTGLRPLHRNSRVIRDSVGESLSQMVKTLVFFSLSGSLFMLAVAQ